ncbi:TetR/AcrR family transcriptional regulator C-terminal domain-containing protein [Actinomadura madurae]|uniref:TetR/AcrR family transcriptional regulator C-terminal domain-containing protein n=1 Tax=Actinomadura madurae TaxID=1993 RepID=UPI00202720F0|nr:TetR/AcrR family transcriptional regulator C-terminal domain-containing protein [Actinomadura madurae]URM96957.1 TetR/AcrR family transcriptional regulator C-terminal domain-containing protein [Actinomadura madurae]
MTRPLGRRVVGVEVCWEQLAVQATRHGPYRSDLRGQKGRPRRIERYFRQQAFGVLGEPAGQRRVVRLYLRAPFLRPPVDEDGPPGGTDHLPVDLQSQAFTPPWRMPGWTAHGCWHAVGALTFYVNGFVAAENTWRFWIRDPSAETKLRSKAQRHLEERPELYPTLALQAQLDDDDFDGQFVLALQMILDGIEAQLSGGSEFSPREG